MTDHTALEEVIREMRYWNWWVDHNGKIRTYPHDDPAFCKEVRARYRERVRGKKAA